MSCNDADLDKLLIASGNYGLTETYIEKWQEKIVQNFGGVLRHNIKHTVKFYQIFSC